MGEELKSLGISTSSNIGVGDGCMHNANNRRNGNHHPNLWSDDFIQSISSQYGNSIYHEHREILINEVCKMFSNNEEEFGLLQRLWFVDVVQSLGIDRYFQEQIKIVLDFTYKLWNENVIGDLNTMALGFRMLRLNRYGVSSDVFQKFKGEQGKFFGCEASQEYINLASMLNLYKASEIDFSGETILKEARDFTLAYLQGFMKEHGVRKENNNPLLMEIEYILKFPWRCRVPRWETWNFIQIFKQQNHNDSPFNHIYKIPNTYKQNLLEVAVLDFNIVQAQHQYELKLVSTWWKNSSVIHLDFFRNRHVEFYFWWACSLFELEFSASRIGFAKLATSLSLIDDIYDTYGTIDELKPFTTSLIRWDISIIENLPEYMKISFKFAFQIHMEITSEGEMKHGPFIHKYIQKSWESYILAYFQEAKWIASNYTPKFDQYILNGTISSGMEIIMMYSMVLMNTLLSNKIMEQFDLSSSKFQGLVSLITRLIDDIKDFEDEKARGETTSSIECYMKENQGSTKEDALNYITNRIDSCVQELNKEFLKPSNMPTCFRNLYFNAGMRGIFFLFKDTDGITHSHHKEIHDAIMKVLFEPIVT